MNKNQRLSALTVLLTSLAGIANTAAADSNLGLLNSIDTPDRHNQKMLRSMKSTSAANDLVHMQQGSFRLDPNYQVQINNEQGYVLLQLSGQLTDEWRAQLESEGATLLEYIPHNTWVSRIKRDSINSLRTLAFVKAMGQLYPADKFPSNLLTHNLSPRSDKGDMLILDVSFHQDQQFDHVMAQLEQLGANSQQTNFTRGNRISVNLPREQLLALAYLESVNWIEEPQSPKAEQNTDAAALVGVSALQTTLADLQGKNIKIGGWESSTPDASHPDLAGRIFIVEGGSNSNHATHVTGTLIGSGINSPSARGMAPEANYYSFNFYGDIPAELAAAATEQDIDISNHSWSYLAGWESNYYESGTWTWFGHPNEEHDSDFGRYAHKTQQWDNLIAATDMIVVKSAGNDRNNHGPAADQGHHHYGDSATLHYDYHAPDGDYDSLDTISSAKNVITVGAVDDSGNMTSYSAWGPTDDDRIKPDIVANGLGVYSTVTNSSYGMMSGTSMAAPVVSGGLALLIEHHQRIFARNPSAATVKALVTHTAQDLGNPGPDYSYGWGLLNIDAAAEIISADNGSGQQIHHGEVSDNSEQLFTVDVEEGTSKLKTTIAWTDPGASPSAAKALINDLDLELIAPDGTVYHPFTLSGRGNPSAPARQDLANRVDNVEQVLVDQPAAGQWQIRIHGHSVQQTQAFAMVNTMNFSVLSAAKTPTAAEPSATSVASSGGGGSLDLFMILLSAVTLIGLGRQHN